jgi:hypothetical protein
MFTIWKYDLGFDELKEIAMPEDARVISCQVQAGVPRLWAVVDTEHPVDPHWPTRVFLTVATGQEIGQENFLRSLLFIATYQLEACTPHRSRVYKVHPSSSGPPARRRGSGIRTPRR